MVAGCAPHSSAAGIRVCGALLLAGATDVAVDYTWGNCVCSGTAGACAGIGACAEERSAGNFWTVRLHAQSVVPWLVVDWGWLYGGGAQLVGGCGSGRDVLCHLSSGDSWRGGLPAAEVPGVRRIFATGAEDVPESWGATGSDFIFDGTVPEASRVQRAAGGGGDGRGARDQDDVLSRLTDCSRLRWVKP